MASDNRTIYLQHSRPKIVARQLAPGLIVDEYIGFHPPSHRKYLIDSAYLVSSCLTLNRGVLTVLILVL